MTEPQRRIFKQRGSQTQPTGGDGQIGLTPTSGETYDQATADLQRVDAAIDGLLKPQPAAGPSVVAGEQRPHQLHTVSNEALVRQFKQQPGE